jgi:hypothetical protein
MSETVNYVGKLKLLENSSNETLEQQAKKILNNCELKSYNDTYLEQLLDNNHESIILYNDNLYEVLEMKDCSETDIFEIDKNEDGTYNYHVSYYNGDCSFAEAIEEAFDRLEETPLKD